jgi:uncharacterized protein
MAADAVAFNPGFIYDDIDARVWREELDPFLPERIYDFHGHVFLAEHAPSLAQQSPDPSMPVVVKTYPHEAFAQVQRTLWPDRKVRALVFGMVDPRMPFDEVNEYARAGAAAHGWDALMVPRITDDAQTLVRKAETGGFLGFKPYWTFVTWKVQSEVTLEDMVTPAMREAADRLGLIIMTHIPRPGRLADPANIQGIRRLCTDAPNAKIILAHFGRSYFIEAVGDGLSLADIPNLYADFSMVQDWEVIELAFRHFDRKRLLFGLDLPVAQEKGKLISVNGQRHFFTKRPHAWSAHVEPGAYEVRCTVFAYEMARAIRKASERVGLTRSEVEDLFWNNATRVTQCRRNP